MFWKELFWNNYPYGSFMQEKPIVPDICFIFDYFPQSFRLNQCSNMKKTFFQFKHLACGRKPDSNHSVNFFVSSHLC